ncbi:MAE_28990/MAE_18760 family HEPN-like nuclease [Massilia arenae]|uniref:MAE_28990/MAE_18760 family HEPN-like nuclease n=1 Tax=Massilia arenae TaxID=2603288 RepID=UPI00351D56AA
MLDANDLNRTVLLKAMVALAYANWEGYVKFSAQKYFDFLTMRRLSFDKLSNQIYINSFLTRLASLSNTRPNIDERIRLISEIIDSQDKRFSYINPDLISTGSNLKSSVLRDICKICGIDYNIFINKETFIDVILLKRRNSIAHGDEALVSIDELDTLVDTVIELMRTFKNELENLVYLKKYMRNDIP